MKRQLLQSAGIHSGDLILVNAEHAYCEPGRVDLVSVGEDVQLERRVAALLAELMRKIRGWNRIVPVSGWRSLGEQQTIWDDAFAQSGEAFARKFVAVPGHSEHQTGLAIDLGLKKDEIDFICPDFPYEGICEEFRSNAASYGFVERYPAGKERVTGIGHEPWHFRYVGAPHALIMKENDLTLEEYVTFLRDYPHGRRPLRYRKHGLDVAISYLKASADGTTALETASDRPHSISGDNVDGFIITEWGKVNGIQRELRRA